jgi:hypothetical protein
MKSSRLFVIFAAMVVVVVGMVPAAQAALSGLGDGQDLTVVQDPVHFWLFDVDGNPSHNVTLSANTLSVSSSSITLQYSYTGAANDFSDFDSPITVDTGSDNVQQIFFRLDIPGPNYATGGDVTFQNYDLNTSENMGIDLFNNLYLVWDTGNFTITITSASGNGRFSNVPIPASALLLFTGLIGLIGFRRRFSGK